MAQRRSTRRKEEENDEIWARLRKEITALEEEDGKWRKEIELANKEKGGRGEVATGVVPDGVSEAVTTNVCRAGEQRRLDDQEDKGDGVRAKESLKGDKLGEMMGGKGGERRGEILEERPFRRGG